MKMKKSNTASRAWDFLLLAILWARKVSVLKRRFILNLPKYIKRIRHTAASTSRGALRYGERQLSFDNTPVVHVKMHRPSSLRFRFPHIPCINPPKVDFDYDFALDNDGGLYNDEESFLKSADEIYYGYGDQEICEEDNHQDRGIDMKAEEFIANFYEQMKLQRQISYLRYEERLLITVD